METKRVLLKQQVLMGIYVLAPFVIVIEEIWRMWGYGVDLVALAIALVGLAVGIISIDVGWHRYFTHRGFAIHHKSIRHAFAVLGSMAGLGSLFNWVGWHIMHHQRTDEKGDPHSPWRFGEKSWEVLWGGLYAHMGWLFVTTSPPDELTEKLREDPVLVWVDQHFLTLLIVSLALPPLVGVFVRESVAYIPMDFAWGGLIRLFYMQHITWSVNSVCHIWGRRPFKVKDQSTNNWVIGLLALGEGWHNNHHAFPKSPKHGLLPGQLDVSWLVIKLLGKLRLFADTNVYVPSRTQIQKRLR